MEPARQPGENEWRWYGRMVLATAEAVAMGVHACVWNDLLSILTDERCAAGATDVGAVERASGTDERDLGGESKVAAGKPGGRGCRHRGWGVSDRLYGAVFAVRRYGRHLCCDRHRRTVLRWGLYT